MNRIHLTTHNLNGIVICNHNHKCLLVRLLMLFRNVAFFQSMQRFKEKKNKKHFFSTKSNFHLHEIRTIFQCNILEYELMFVQVCVRVLLFMPPQFWRAKHSNVLLFIHIEAFNTYGILTMETKKVERFKCHFKRCIMDVFIHLKDIVQLRKIMEWKTHRYTRVAFFSTLYPFFLPRLLH